MSKKEIFSRFNLKDYNKELELILEEKDFTSQVKNLLLSMFYKLEIGYKDYAIVKSESKTKEEFLEDILYIIKEKCDKIDLIKPKEDEQYVEKYIAFPEKNMIQCYQNEASILHALLKLEAKNFKMQNIEDLIKIPLQNMLNEGYELDIKEAVTNFDGWSWNNSFDKTDKIEFFLVYELLKMIMGNRFMDDWKKDTEDDKDYLKEIRKKSRELYNAICRICIIIMANSEEGKKQIATELKKAQETLLKMENKTEFLREKYDIKSELMEKLKIIDKTINDKEMLKEEFEIRNKKLGDDSKIFSISDLAEILQNERKQIVKETEIINKTLEPKTYLNTIERLRDEIELVKDSNYKKVDNEKLNKELIDIQLIFMEHVKKFLSITEEKKEIQDFVFKFRYYLYLPIRTNDEIVEIKDVIELQQDISKLEKNIITKACKFKIMVIINQDIGYNANIIKKIINTKQIELTNIIATLSKEENEIKICIFDGEVLDRTEMIEKDKEKDFKIKFDKKFKLFN